MFLVSCSVVKSVGESLGCIEKEKKAQIEKDTEVQIVEKNKISEGVNVNILVLCAGISMLTLWLVRCSLKKSNKENV